MKFEDKLSTVEKMFGMNTVAFRFIDGWYSVKSSDEEQIAYTKPIRKNVKNFQK
ncbi:MAG: hypothetical protein ACLRQF_18695 [Thomasclavelia ramosa]